MQKNKTSYVSMQTFLSRSGAGGQVIEESLLSGSADLSQTFNLNFLIKCKEDKKHISDHLISFRRNKKEALPIMIKDQPIEIVQSTKYVDICLVDKPN